MYLIIQKGTRVVDRILLDQRSISIGSDARDDVKLNAADASPNHAEVKFVNNTYTITDRGSATGIYVNNVKLQNSATIRPDDIINIGQYTIYLDAGEASQTAPEIPKQMSEQPHAAAQQPSVEFKTIRESAVAAIVQKIKENRAYRIGLMGIIVILIFVIGISMLPGDDPNWPVLVEHYQKGEYGQALKIAETVLQKDPNNQDYLAAVSKIKEKMGADIDAQLTQAQNLIKNNNEADINQAISILVSIPVDHARYQDAQELLKEAENSNEILNFESSAKQDMDAGNYTESLAAIEHILTIDPTYPAAQSLKIQVLEKVGQKQESENEWRAALATWNSILAIEPTQEDALKGKARAETALHAPRVKQRQTVNRQPIISSIIAGNSELSEHETTWIKASASDPDGDKLYYEWAATNGTIEGMGEKIIYKAPDVLNEDKIDRIVVSVNDARKGAAAKYYSMKLIKKQVQLTQQQKDEARDIYYQAYREEVDYQNFARARELYEKTMLIAPDPGFEFYKKAQARLQQLKED
ncbi:FHA domain-containing protein [candidate division KSB1 bacterium]|nr:FHA domain-containing protein [candidate division KSB1 bacterium]